jgi:pheromone shutdown-related protein TraB
MRKISLIGTSHIARQSVIEIKKKIIDDKPEIIAVEIDVMRLQALFTKKRKIKLSDVFRLGVMGFLFTLIGSYIQRKLGEKVGVAPGSDIKVAIIYAGKIGAKLFLIDRPIVQTMRRLSEAMTFWTKMKFIGYLIFGSLIPSENLKKIKKLDLRKVPEAELIEILSKELKSKFPELYKVLIKERDMYMAKQIEKIANDFPSSDILAIMGAGHVKGVSEYLKKKNIL